MKVAGAGVVGKGIAKRGFNIKNYCALCIYNIQCKSIINYCIFHSIVIHHHICKRVKNLHSVSPLT